MNKANALFDKIEQIVKQKDSDEVFIFEITQDDGSRFVSDADKAEVMDRCQCHASMDSMIKALLDRLEDIRSSWLTINKALDVLTSISSIDRLFQTSHIRTIYKACKSKDGAPAFVKESRRDLMSKLSNGYAKNTKAQAQVPQTTTRREYGNTLMHESGNRRNTQDDEFDDFVSSQDSVADQSFFSVLTKQPSNNPAISSLEDVVFFNNDTNHAAPSFDSSTNFFSMDTAQKSVPAAASFHIQSVQPTNQSFYQTPSYNRPQEQFGAFPKSSIPFSNQADSNFIQQQQPFQSSFASQQNFHTFGDQQSSFAPSYPQQFNQPQPVVLNSFVHKENKNSLSYMKNHGKSEIPQEHVLDQFINDTFKKL